MLLSELEFKCNVSRIKKFRGRHMFITIKDDNWLKFDPIFSYQILIDPEHSDNIVRISQQSANIDGKVSCDGLLTNVGNVSLALYSADCFPIMMTTTDNKFIGLIHAGWRGTDKEIARKAVETAAISYKVKPENILIGIGPGIHRCCYNDENLATNLLKDSRWYSFIGYSLGKSCYIDFLDFNIKQLVDAGISRNNILATYTCTCCSMNDKREYLFPSHYRAKKENKNECWIKTVLVM
jgi:YfiH family protein